MTERLIIFDTTLRDGEQAGHKMSPETKLEIALRLSDLGVDVIEAGFPFSSEGDFNSVSKIAEEVRGAIICALSRAREEDVNAALRATEPAERRRIHTFMSTSDIHLKHKVKMTRSQALESSVMAVSLARRHCDDVEYSLEDATRTAIEYAVEIIEAVIRAGATTINIADTVGYSIPHVFEAFVQELRRRVLNSSEVTWSVHCHNDLGLATANTLAGVYAGARQVEGCMLGIGERAGNVALEEVIAALSCREDIFGVSTNIDMSKIGPVCRFNSRQIGYPIGMHKPIIGSNAFQHSSGIHADGVIKDRSTYEIMKPEDVGWEESGAVVLQSHMGRNGLKKCISGLGYDGDDLVTDVFPLFKSLADVKPQITEDDFHMLIQEVRAKRIIDAELLYNLDDVKYENGAGSVTVTKNKKTLTRSHKSEKGNGAVSATFVAIQKTLNDFGENMEGLSLDDYTVIKGDGGPEAIGWVVITVSRNGSRGYGRCGGMDIVIASAKAYLHAMNNLLNNPVVKDGL